MNNPKLNLVNGNQKTSGSRSPMDTIEEKSWRPGSENTDMGDNEEMGSAGESAFDMESITPGLKVYSKSLDEDSDEEEDRVGTIDHMEGSRYIKLTKNDSIDGKHHWIPIEWIDRVDSEAVYLNKDLDEVESSMHNSFPGEEGL